MEGGYLDRHFLKEAGKSGTFSIAPKSIALLETEVGHKLG